MRTVSRMPPCRPGRTRFLRPPAEGAQLAGGFCSPFPWCFVPGQDRQWDLREPCSEASLPAPFFGGAGPARTSAGVRDGPVEAATHFYSLKRLYRKNPYLRTICCYLPCTLGLTYVKFSICINLLLAHDPVTITPLDTREQ